MPEYLRSFIVVMALSLPAFLICKPWIVPAWMSDNDFNGRAKLWFVLTISAFLANNFWLFCIIAFIAAIYYSRRDSNPLALYMFVVLAVPPYSIYLPGFAGIQNLFEVSSLTVLAFAILIPEYAKVRSTKLMGRVALHSVAIDRIVLCFLAWQAFLIYPVTTFTDFCRNCFNLFIQVYLPYFVASRSPVDAKRLREVMLSFATGVLVLSGIAVFEYFKHWLLYAPVAGQLGVPTGLGAYLPREASLRAIATTGHPIALGYMCMVAVCFWYSGKASATSFKSWRLGVLLITATLLVALSRGPWVGMVAAVVFLWLFDGNRKAFSKYIMFGGFLMIPLFMFTDVGTKLVGYIPFVGEVDASNVDYRQRLIEVCMQILQRNFYFGSFDYLSDPLMASMNQGGGFVDMVNSYLVIAMSYGAVGFMFFALALLFATAGAFRSMLRYSKDSLEYRLGTVLVAAMIGIEITIATVSSIVAIPTVYWLVTGLCVAYVRVVSHGSAAFAQKDVAKGSVSPQSAYV